MSGVEREEGRDVESFAEWGIMCVHVASQKEKVKGQSASPQLCVLHCNLNVGACMHF